MFFKMFLGDRHLPSDSTSTKEPQTRTKNSTLATHLQRVLNDRRLYQQLLRFRNSDAQALLDTFQSLLDTSELDTQLRRLLIVATQRLSERSGLYPVCYKLQGVKQIETEPVTAGGFADIYRAKLQGQVVCLKVIRLYQDSQLEHVLKKFSKEVILWGQLSHPHVLPMYGLYRYRNKLCFVAPWMENGDIGAYLKRNPKADRPSLSVDVGQGLRYLHMNGVIHGDLKSSNILIDEGKTARLCDFGISCVSDPDIVVWTSQSSVSSKGGSVRWQAPELLETENGRDEAVKNSKASDIYSLGCVFYEIYTGNIPFHSISRDPTVILQIQHGCRPLRPSKSNSAWQEWGLTESTWALIEDCWKYNPTERPTIDQVLQKIFHQDLRQNKRLRPRLLLSSEHFRQRMNEPLNETSKAVSVKLLYNIIQSSVQAQSSIYRSPYLVTRNTGRTMQEPRLRNSSYSSYMPSLSTDSSRPLSLLQQERLTQLDNPTFFGWDTLGDGNRPKEAMSLADLAKIASETLIYPSSAPKTSLGYNTPVTTLIVGNLAAASLSSSSPDHLETSLRKLFSLRAGFRQLIFRQNNVGPMCFVEFEDVAQATKALIELHGDTLNGLVKGGIRLMYNKKPLRVGVRPPTSVARRDAQTGASHHSS